MKQYFLFFVAVVVTLTGCGGDNGLHGCWMGPNGCAKPSSETPAPTLPDKTRKVISVELTRKTINLGESTDLVITIDKAAPSGGYSFSANAESDGTEDTFKPTLINALSLNNTIPQNKTKTTIHLQTQRVRNAAKRVVFYVGTLQNSPGDTLIIDP